MAKSKRERVPDMGPDMEPAPAEMPAEPVEAAGEEPARLPTQTEMIIEDLGKAETMEEVIGMIAGRIPPAVQDKPLRRAIHAATERILAKRGL